MEKLFMPHELKTVEIDVEKRSFKINGEDFGKNCTGFTMTCNGVDDFNIRVEVDTTVQFATYNGKSRTSVEEHPAFASWYSDGKKRSGERQ